MCEEGRAQFWTNGDGNIVTEIETYPRLRAIRFWLIAGELKQCLALEPRIEAWARKQDCTVAIAMGRPGWGRVAAATGWKPWWPSFQKRLA